MTDDIERRRQEFARTMAAAYASTPFETRSPDGVWVYASEPVAITEPGQYRLRFGPIVDPEFNPLVPGSSGISFNHPVQLGRPINPDWTAGPPHFVDEDGSRWITFTVAVPEGAEPCERFFMFIHGHTAPII
ncbi:hypothetical protein ACFFX1_11810 [Dactylosporangium sucinum]|uniref:Uncharacterized protein n=1 Tax=Dactylosporangium sucinum TaxID=1424081 RepID=A0A917TMN6_9ACTN|nr:hypothetical protein [Dactylosporangium sucinum]GGM27759.1 hypothetical protein GCM10007977_031290 [Dactylosporangium sucinum]